MHLIVRLFPHGPMSRRVVAEMLPPERQQVTSARYGVRLDDPALPALLAGGDHADGFGIGGEAVFTRAELATVTHFELVCRKVLRPSAADDEGNRARCLATPLVDAGGPEPIRLVTGFRLTRVDLAPNAVAAIGDATPEYVVGTAVAAALERDGCRGVDLRPVYTANGTSAHTSARQLFSEHVLPPCVLDGSVERITSRYPEQDGALRHLGGLAYAAASLAGQPDLARTAEPWAGWYGWPSWVVSRHVVEVLRRHQVRGWQYRPVLITEQPLYRAYDAQWQALAAAISGTARSRFDGSRW